MTYNQTYVNVELLLKCIMYSRTPRIRINWDGESSRYAENTNNGYFLENGLYWQFEFGCYYLQYVPASKPFDHA